MTEKKKGWKKKLENGRGGGPGERKKKKKKRKSGENWEDEVRQRKKEEKERERRKSHKWRERNGIKNYFFIAHLSVPFQRWNGTVHVCQNLYDIEHLMRMVFWCLVCQMSNNWHLAHLMRMLYDIWHI